MDLINSLEYINNDIKTCQRLIKKLEKSIDTYDEVLQGPLDPIDHRFYRPKQDFIDQLNRYKNTLNILQRIKAELEAWYEVRKDFILEWNNPNDASGYYCKYLGDLEYNKIKKGMN